MWWLCYYAVEKNLKKNCSIAYSIFVALCGALWSWNFKWPKNLNRIRPQTDEMTQCIKLIMLKHFQFDCSEFLFCHFIFYLLFESNSTLKIFSKIIQKDIESHSKIINSVLKLSTKLKQICADCFHYYDKVSILQNRWHCLWLNSLEWQCRLEQLHQIPKVSLI